MVTVTQAVLAAAGEQGDKAAVVDAADGRRVTYADLAEFVPAAAAGLAKRGLLPGDVAAVHLISARDHTLAVHALGAAGVVPAPVGPDLSADDLADLLVEIDARALVTTESLAGVAVEAVERSYVRQVFAFGAVPGATPFGDLAAAGPAPVRTADPAAALLICDEPGGPMALTHAERVADLRRLLATGECDDSDIVAARVGGLPARIRADIIDAALISGGTLIAVCEPGEGAFLRAVRDHRPTAAIVGPGAQRRDGRPSLVSIGSAPPPRSRGGVVLLSP